MRLRGQQQLYQAVCGGIVERAQQQLGSTGQAAAAAAAACRPPTFAGQAGSHVCADACIQQQKTSCLTGVQRTGRSNTLSSELGAGAAHQLQQSKSISYCHCLQQQRSTFRSDLNTLATQAAETVAAAQDQSRTASKVRSLLSKSGRFYDTVTIITESPAPGQQQELPISSGSSKLHKLQLAKYPIKTPAKNLLVLPTYSLALAVAAEWEWLPRGKPVPHLMPLTSLAATAIDQPREKPKVIEHLLKYVHTDSACIRYEPGPLQRRQAKAFDPLLQWAQQDLGWDLHTTDSIAGTTQPEQTVAAVQRYLEGLDRWHLAAAEQLTTASKSVVIAAAVLHNRLTAAEAVAAARLEEEFQLEDWGMVEAGHDLDIADTNSRITAPAVFCKLLAQP